MIDIIRRRDGRKWDSSSVVHKGVKLDKFLDNLEELPIVRRSGTQTSVKYPDGRMVVYGTYSFSGQVLDYWGEVGSINGGPIIFIDKFSTIDGCVITPTNGVPGWLVGDRAQDGELTVSQSQNVRLFTIRQFLGENATVKVSFYAFGRWK